MSKEIIEKIINGADVRETISEAAKISENEDQLLHNLETVCKELVGNVDADLLGEIYVALLDKYGENTLNNIPKLRVVTKDYLVNVCNYEL